MDGSLYDVGPIVKLILDLTLDTEFLDIPVQNLKLNGCPVDCVIYVREDNDSNV